MLRSPEELKRVKQKTDAKKKAQEKKAAKKAEKAARQTESGGGKSKGVKRKLQVIGDNIEEANDEEINDGDEPLSKKKKPAEIEDCTQDHCLYSHHPSCPCCSSKTQNQHKICSHQTNSERPVFLDT